MDEPFTRIGIVVPPGNVVVERELPQLLPDGVLSNVNRLSRPSAEVSLDALVKMNASLKQAAIDLSMCHPAPRVILHACTSSAFAIGADGEGRALSEVTEACGIPVVSAATAMTEAIRHLSPAGLSLQPVCRRGERAGGGLSR
jgi:maleate isomerase